VHPLGHFGHASFKLTTEAHPSSIENRGSGVCLGPTAPASRRPAVVDVQDRDRAISLSSGYKSGRQWKISPLRYFFIPAEVSSTISSPLASHRATGPFFNSFGGFTPLTRVLLLPQFALSSGKDFSLHCTSHRRPLLNAGELLLLCFPPLMRHGLMSMVVLCSLGANVRASSSTLP
jgi:hypothetical protein